MACFIHGYEFSDSLIGHQSAVLGRACS